MSSTAPLPGRARGGDAWFPAGLASSFPDVTAEDSGNLAEPRPCGAAAQTGAAGCRVFHVPRRDGSGAAEVELGQLEPPEAGGLKDQVLVFRYRGKFHAVNHECPHSSYPLSSGRPFDIEDFGIVLSSGITCPKHGWSFDLFSGRSDRGSYKLQVWELELRPVAGSRPEAAIEGGEGEVVAEEKEVWVRRKQRMG